MVYIIDDLRTRNAMELKINQRLILHATTWYKLLTHDSDINIH